MQRRRFLGLAGLAGLAAAAPLRLAGATKIASVRAGLWSDPGTWNLGRIPQSGDQVVVKHLVTLDTSAAVRKVTVNAPGSLEFHPDLALTLSSKGNVVVAGVLTMRPSSPAVVHTLRFAGAVESKFVGGGNAPIGTDVGLWVTGAGRLELVGSPKVAWNRTGDDPSWATSDELVVAPIGRGEQIVDDSPFAPFIPGGQVPTVTMSDGTVFTAEVLNLTRNVRVEGLPGARAHVWISSSGRQSISHVAIRHMGPRHGAGQGSSDVLGRYGLHLHHCGEANAGQVFEGLVVRDCGSHAYALHDSNGITLRACISYDTLEDAFWWDPPAETYPSPPNPVTHRTTYDGCVAALVRSDPPFEGYRLAGFVLGAGDGNACRGCVAVGVQGSSDGGGFLWPEFAPWNTGVWVFEDNLAHNCSRNGASVWQVNSWPHVVERLTAYHNGKCGVFNGAYGNAYRWSELALYANGGNPDGVPQPEAPFMMWAGATQVENVPSGLPWAVLDSKLSAEGVTESALILAGRAVVQLELEGGGEQAPGEVGGCTMRGYTREAVLLTFSFHDFGPYDTQWHLAGNDLGPGLPFWVDDGGLGCHPDTTLDVDGVGTLHPMSYPGGIPHPEWNAKVT